MAAAAAASGNAPPSGVGVRALRMMREEVASTTPS
jgi:hypothetical protein